MRAKMLGRRSGHERRKSEIENQKESARWRCPPGCWRTCVWGFSAGELGCEFSDDGCEAQGIRGLPGNQGRGEGHSLGGDRGALWCGGFADSEAGGQRNESEER